VGGLLKHRHRSVALYFTGLTFSERAQREMLEEKCKRTSGRRKSGLPANMSHEIRTPMNAIWLYGDARAGGLTTKAIRITSRHSLTAAPRSAKLINDI